MPLAGQPDTIMKDIIDWLIRVEGMAMRFYDDASRLFAADKDLSGLLMELSGNEKLHYEAVMGAYELVKEKDHPPHIILDSETRQSIESFVLECARKLGSGLLTGEELMDAIITLETSEINGLFLYVMNSLKKRPGRPLAASLDLEEHMERIRKFVRSRPEFTNFRERVDRLPDATRKNLLVVDDEEAVANAFNIILKDQGNVFVASNGKEALELVSERDFAAIVTDIDMPAMNGIEFYNEATRQFPPLKSRFVFLSGAYNVAAHEFMRLHSLKFLDKPASIKDIRRSVAEIIEAR